MTEHDWHDLDDDNPPPDPWGDQQWAHSGEPPAASSDTAGTRSPEALTASAFAAGDSEATSSPAPNDLRARVLAHPDLAARLCDPPLRYSRPDCWTGYIPAETWQGQRNDSPRRLQLLGIVAELEGRE